jgi:predicted nucleotidyltransferase
MIVRNEHLHLELPNQRIAEICRQFGVTELSVFGSVLRDDFRPESDVDLLVTFDSDDLGPWMSRLSDFQAALSSLLARPVDVALRSGVERSENYIRRRHILQSAVPICVTA